MKEDCPLKSGKELEMQEQAMKLLESMDALRRTWGLMRPPPPLTRSDMMLMNNMHHLQNNSGEPVTVSGLAQRMKQSAPGISQKITLLEKQGYIQRAGHGHDRRVVALELTEKGRKITTQAMYTYLCRLQKALEDLGEEKTTRFLELLEELQQSIEKVQTQEDNTPEC